jgi:hypothetical protein
MILFYYYYQLLTGDSYPPVLLPLGCLQLSLLEVIAPDECLPQTVLSKNPYIGQKGAQKATEDIEKYFFANQEMLRKKGFESAEQQASAISAPQLTDEDATKFEDVFGLGFSCMKCGNHHEPQDGAHARRM